PDATAPVVRQDGPVLPVWVGAADALLAVTTAANATGGPALVEAGARRGVSVLGAGPADSLLHEACGRNRAGYVALPSGRHPRANLWSVLVPMLLPARGARLIADDRVL